MRGQHMSQKMLWTTFPGLHVYLWPLAPRGIPASAPHALRPHACGPAGDQGRNATMTPRQPDRPRSLPAISGHRLLRVPRGADQRPGYRSVPAPCPGLVEALASAARSQKDRMTGARTDRLVAEWLLPPHVPHLGLKTASPSATQGRSRMP